MSSPTALLRCVSTEKAAELAELLVLTCACPATAADLYVTAPIDDIGFVFHVAAVAVSNGFASDSAAVAFQSAGIDLAEGRR